MILPCCRLEYVTQQPTQHLRDSWQPENKKATPKCSREIRYQYPVIRDERGMNPIPISSQL
ncbi:hypothetical protein [Xenorhabdus beddingii]|uniref:hypothetical protein n=1 Tax=Xenorhabdus beddingii TaxID=40578 RepID=UPI00111C8280|nr:hypothetical protein [Xenorhabdus beddingii]